MGMILRRSFKGTHVWIPPIEKQIADITKIYNHHKSKINEEVATYGV